MTTDTNPADMTDSELYHQYQDAKQHGPVERIDELQLEIAKRWEETHETGATTDSRVRVTQQGRYTEIHIDGVADGALALDHESVPTSVIVTEAGNHPDESSRSIALASDAIDDEVIDE